jgi:hypothetical protein
MSLSIRGKKYNLSYQTIFSSCDVYLVIMYFIYTIILLPSILEEKQYAMTDCMEGFLAKTKLKDLTEEGKATCRRH